MNRTPTTLALLAALATASCTTAPDPLFQKGDANRDGFINTTEIHQYIAARMMGSYDVDCNQSISFAEVRRVKPEATRAGFSRRDTNGDGQIDSAELLASVRANPTFGKLMTSIDTDGDGLASPGEIKAFQGHMDEL